MVYIISHPMTGNYGGMLQAFALNACIVENTESLSSIYDYTPNNIKRIKSNIFLNIKIFLCFILRCLKIKNSPVPYWIYLLNSERFKYLLTSQPCKTHFTHIVSFSKSDTFVVGSDQIWRASYANLMKDIAFYFLGFASSAQRNRSFSYAASFGSDEWEGIPEETEECGRLLREFKAVSVREHSGVKICKEVFGVEAVQMPDPTLLLHPEDYGKIIYSEKTWIPDSKYAAVYVLDETEEKAKLMQISTGILGVQLQHLMPHTAAEKQRDRFPISVPQWLRLIRDCEYFITDSFHGCVFAIIYNKPFVCLGNENRGKARFDTLLDTFELEDRLITDATPENIVKILNTPINWERVNTIHDTERERGINFLKENLSES